MGCARKKFAGQAVWCVFLCRGFYLFVGGRCVYTDSFSIISSFCIPYRQCWHIILYNGDLYAEVLSMFKTRTSSKKTTMNENPCSAKPSLFFFFFLYPGHDLPVLAERGVGVFVCGLRLAHSNGHMLLLWLVAFALPVPNHACKRRGDQSPASLTFHCLALFFWWN